MDTSTRIQKINEALTQLHEATLINKIGKYGVNLAKKIMRTRMGRDILTQVAVNKALSSIAPKGRVGIPQTQGISPPGMDDPSQQYGAHTDMPGRSPTLNWQMRNAYRGQ